MNLSVKKVEANRNFANKIWNAGRFCNQRIQQDRPGAARGAGLDASRCVDLGPFTGPGARRRAAVQGFQYGEAGRQIYEFFWGDFADWYVEAAKLQLAQGGERAATTAYGLARVLDTSLRLLHPFTPFVTEELWGHLRKALLDSPLAETASGWPEALIVAPWPMPRPVYDWEEDSIAQFGLVQDVVRGIRNLRSEKGVPTCPAHPGDAGLRLRRGHVAPTIRHVGSAGWA